MLRERFRIDRGSRCEFPGCVRDWVDMNEIKRRSRGGSDVDPANIICLCRPCHEWVTANDGKDGSARAAVIVTALPALWGWPVPVVVLARHSWE